MIVVNSKHIIMNRNLQLARQDAIIEQYKKGTKLKVIMEYFSITRAGIYWILKKYEVDKKSKHLTK